MVEGPTAKIADALRAAEDLARQCIRYGEGHIRTAKRVLYLVEEIRQEDHHSCLLPAVVGMAAPLQPDWTCGTCGRVWHDCRTQSGLHWWAEARSGVAA